MFRLLFINRQRNNNIKLRSCARHVLGYKTMKKIFAITIAIALIALVGANALYVNAKTTKTEVAPVIYAASTRCIGRM